MFKGLCQCVSIEQDNELHASFSRRATADSGRLCVGCCSLFWVVELMSPAAGTQSLCFPCERLSCGRLYMQTGLRTRTNGQTPHRHVRARFDIPRNLAYHNGGLLMVRLSVSAIGLQATHKGKIAWDVVKVDNKQQKNYCSTLRFSRYSELLAVGNNRSQLVFKKSHCQRQGRSTCGASWNRSSVILGTCQEDKGIIIMSDEKCRYYCYCNVFYK